MYALKLALVCLGSLMALGQGCQIDMDDGVIRLMPIDSEPHWAPRDSDVAVWKTQDGRYIGYDTNGDGFADILWDTKKKRAYKIEQIEKNLAASSDSDEMLSIGYRYSEAHHKWKTEQGDDWIADDSVIWINGEKYIVTGADLGLEQPLSKYAEEYRSTYGLADFVGVPIDIAFPAGRIDSDADIATVAIPWACQWGSPAHPDGRNIEHELFAFKNRDGSWGAYEIHVRGQVSDVIAYLADLGVREAGGTDHEGINWLLEIDREGHSAIITANGDIEREWDLDD